MSDTRWLEIEDDAAAAVHHFSMANAIFEQGGMDGQSLDSYKSRMAFMHSMQSAYTSLENSLRRILVLLPEELPKSETWHADLVRRCSRATANRPAILSADLARAVDEARRFRHVAARTYDSFVTGGAAPAVLAARAIGHSLLREIGDFKKRVDPDDEQNTPNGTRWLDKDG